MDIADSRLADPDLSPAMLAREFNVSVRTLYRAFAMAEESVAGYIRRQRLEQARRELAASPGRPDVAEVAARWQFADSSHFIRAFKRQYGETPAQFARSERGQSSARLLLLACGRRQVTHPTAISARRRLLACAAEARCFAPMGWLSLTCHHTNVPFEERAVRGAQHAPVLGQRYPERTRRGTIHRSHGSLASGTTPDTASDNWWRRTRATPSSARPS